MRIRIALGALFLLLAVAGSVSFFAVPLRAETLQERRARLEQQLFEIERDITEKRGVLSEKQKERTSLERDIAILDSQISVAKQQIKHRDLTISKLGDDITVKKTAIGEVDKKVSRSEQSLAQLIRRTREIDDTSLTELMLAGTLSELFQDIDNFETLQRDLNRSFDEMATLRSDLSARKEALEEKQGEEEQLRRIQVLEKQAIEKREKEKQQILAVTKGQEKVYQELIADREHQAAVIRSALFELRDTNAISFGSAYQYAKEASAKTGVRPALILAILREETNLGENIGTGNWKRDMHPTRDQPVFAQITAELGLDPDSMPVSKKPSYGWGGAMGPAQFIPSTWKQYKDRIARATGESPPNPWTPRTAIFASSILMSDNGADAGTREAERLAALRYFAGWTNAKKASYAFYGDDVMDFADQYQKDIDILEGR
ncbi:lytic murein transglycosylase [Candidatus Kaiserbacteria bacterium]|nr:lytic murein transglycosylase [Candidatus Kaiserbacteria bacterium]